MTKKKSQLKLSTAMRDAFIDADPSLSKSSAGVIHRTTMWNVTRDNSPRKLNQDWVRPRKNFTKKKDNRSQMYDYARH